MSVHTDTIRCKHDSLTNIYPIEEKFLLVQHFLLKFEYEA